MLICVCFFFVGLLGLGSGARNHSFWTKSVTRALFLFYLGGGHFQDHLLVAQQREGEHEHVGVFSCRADGMLV